MIPESVREWSRRSRSNPMQCRRLAPQKVELLERLERLEFLERHREGGCQRGTAHDYPGRLPGRIKSEPKGGCDFAAKCDLAESGMNQRSAPTVFSELVKACEQVDKDYERFTGIAVTHSHFRSRAISVQDAHEAVRRLCR